MKKLLIIVCTIPLLLVGGKYLYSQTDKKVMIHELEDRGGLAYLPKSDKPFTGTVYAYFPDGKTVYLKSDFVNGKQHGEYIEYLKNGRINYKRSYSNGRENGEWIEYFNDGKIRKKSNYKNGKLHGEWVTYFNNGKVRVKGQYKNGDEVGEWFEWDEKGNPVPR